MTQAGDGAPLAIIAAAIRRERDRAGISLSELAKRAGLAKSTLSQLESGTGNPSVETLWALGGALGVPFNRLVDPPRRSEPHGPGMLEHVWIGTGSALVGPSTEPVELSAGDYVTYPGDVPHVFDALAPGTTAITVQEYA